MSTKREQRAKYNILFTLVGQLITLICGLVVPRLMIRAFGSEAYGATTSITQFLAYITLLEGGIGGVARAALYKPLAENDKKTISKVVREIQYFFRVIAAIFLVYVLILACSFKYISKVQCFDWLSTFFLVIVISISTVAQYFIGISYQVLIQAAQRTYITQIISSVATILNTILIVMLTMSGKGLITVKLVSSLIFTLRPFVQYLYVKKEFNLEKTKERDKKILEQKWTGLGQHIAFFLHSNTDVAVLTVMANLTYVAIYSVYYMVVLNIQNLTTSFLAGMEALFGDMLARNEIKQLCRVFDIYESIISFVAGILFSVTAVMIIPFIKLYTAGINDVNYMRPLFGLLLVISAYFYCLRMPYHSITIAAGHFEQTKFAAYGEAIMNIILSIILVNKYNIIGVAIATVIAVMFRTVYYVLYLANNIFYRRIGIFIKRTICNFVSFAVIVLIGNKIVHLINVINYQRWFFCSIMVFVWAAIIQIVVLRIFYKEFYKEVLRKILG